MKLIEWLRLKGNTQARLGAQTGVSQGAVSQWLRAGVPAERVRAIVVATKGAVTVHDLRPDLYPEGFEFPPPDAVAPEFAADQERAA